MKLQEAYAAEKNEVGSWAEVGYKGPGSQKDASNSETSSFTYGEGDAEGTRVATTQVALNDCPKDATWSVATAYTSTDGTINTTASSSNEAACVTALTFNFCKIATNGTCTPSGNGGYQ